MVLPLIVTVLGLLPPSRAGAETISLCGEVYRSGDCQVFHPFWDSSERLYVLPDSVEVPYRIEILVRGEVQECHRGCDGIPFWSCLTDVEISVCEPERLGCGLLRKSSPEDPIDQCHTWAPLDDLEDMILVDTLDGFVSGDTVYATGIRMAIPDVCICGCGVLLHTDLVACADSASAVSTATWGRLKALFRE